MKNERSTQQIGERKSLMEIPLRTLGLGRNVNDVSRRT
jgi:hypothetical protein